MFRAPAFDAVSNRRDHLVLPSIRQAIAEFHLTNHSRECTGSDPALPRELTTVSHPAQNQLLVSFDDSGERNSVPHLHYSSKQSHHSFSHRMSAIPGPTTMSVSTAMARERQRVSRYYEVRRREDPGHHHGGSYVHFPDACGPYKRLDSSYSHYQDSGRFAGGDFCVAVKRRGNLPKETTDKLRAWFFAHMQHPYPTQDEKLDLMHQTGLQLNQISNWFINARRRQLPDKIKRPASRKTPSTKIAAAWPRDDAPTEQCTSSDEKTC